MYTLERIFELVKKKKIQQKDLATNIGVRPSTLSDWKKQRIKPSVDDIIKIAQYFNVSTDYILGLTDIPCNTLSQSQTELTENEREILRILNTIPDKRQQIKFIGRIEQEAKEYAASKDIVKQFKEIGDAQLAALGSSAQTVETPNPDLVNDSIENLKNT